MNKGPFCNSDKYSFLISFQQVVNSLPEEMLQALKHGEARMEEMGVREEQETPAIIRRRYLMDLYRFFRLCPNRQVFVDPFYGNGPEPASSVFFFSLMFSKTPIDAHKLEVAKVMMKHMYQREAGFLLNTIPKSMRDIQFYLLQGNYDEALHLEPNNERALVGKARKQFKDQNYAEASDLYERLVLLHPDKVSYMLNKAVCLVNMEEYEDALKLLYQLNYEHEEDVNIQRVLAWALTCDGKLAQADRLYQQLTSNESATEEDYLNNGYCQWLMGNIKEADACFDKYFELGGDYFEILENEKWLNQRGIGDTDIKMMMALISQHDSVRRAEERAENG